VASYLLSDALGGAIISSMLIVSLLMITATLLGAVICTAHPAGPPRGRVSPADVRTIVERVLRKHVTGSRGKRA